MCVCVCVCVCVSVCVCVFQNEKIKKEIYIFLRIIHVVYSYCIFPHIALIKEHLIFFSGVVSVYIEVTDRVRILVKGWSFF